MGILKILRSIAARLYFLFGAGIAPDWMIEHPDARREAVKQAGYSQEAAIFEIFQRWAEAHPAELAALKAEMQSDNPPLILNDRIRDYLEAK